MLPPMNRSVPELAQETGIPIVHYSSAGGTFTAGKVNWIRHAYRIASGCPQGPWACPDGQRGDGRYGAKAAAALLNVDVSTIAQWCTAGRLDCIQSAPHGPRWIKLTPERIADPVF